MAVMAITIVSAVFAGVSKLNSYEHRLSQVEASNSIRNSENQMLATELKSLNTKLTDLTIELREMRASQRAVEDTANRFIK